MIDPDGMSAIPPDGFQGDFWEDESGSYHNLGSLTGNFGDFVHVDGEGNSGLHNSGAEELDPVDVVGELSDHQRTMQNPVVNAVHQGHRNVIRGSMELTTHVAGQFGTGVSTVGYGAAFIPGAQPIAGGLIATGNTLSTVSSLGVATLDFSEGNKTGAVLNTANALIPGVANKFIDRNVARGIIGTQGGNILKGGNNAKSEVADYLINR